MTFFLLAAVAKIALVWAVMLAALLPNLVWMERRGAGLIQDRPGPNRVGPLGLFQAVADVLKMFLKEDVTPLYVDKLLHTVAPAILLVPALTTFAVIPFGSSIPVAGRDVKLVIADVNIGILYVLALTSVGVYGLVLAGWASNNKYSLLGGLRSSAQVISYELSMGLAAIATFVTAGSLKPSAVVDWQVANLWNCVPQFVGFVVFVVAAFAETNRVPFDLPEAEAELVAGYHTEYSAFKFGMFFMSEYANMIAASAMIVTLYLGGWALPFVTFTGVWGGVLSIVVFWAKTLAVISVFIWVRWTLPRFRYDQLMSLGWKVLLPLSVLNLLAVAWVVAMKGPA
ncbi:MAG TPA: NADH-quinone oxidoreductase subunit NuoH [Thermoanaerobaculia bacterium]|nr:NADH-quinone oxidoreductase subunit NuoH [Thermoanaerobaculia bacterium]HQR66167.1 NADH-quinone oxidoreductase subunit NuoH [Thermoanaerobaculia bacterium]